ncbi:MAG TPA: YdeI/OmpD-associated family protein [Chthoniobacterales bacterium]
MDCNRPASKNLEIWIENVSEFFRPLCRELRERILEWEPDLTESIKWNVLCFSGRKRVCGLSGCKKHVGIALFRGVELADPAGLFTPAENNTSIRSIRITGLDGFNREAFRRMLHAAMLLDADPTLPPMPPRKRDPWPAPDFFAKALKKYPAAAAGFQRLAPTYQREYLIWLTTAKREETREQRLAQTLQALAAGRKWADRKPA